MLVLLLLGFLWGPNGRTTVAEVIEIDCPGNADELVEELANAVLGATAMDADTVRVLDLGGSDIEDVMFEIGWYSDRLGITDMRVIEAAVVSPREGTQTNE